MKYFIIVLGFLFLLNSCAPHRIINRTDTLFLNSKNISMVEGCYENFDSLNSTALWKEIKPFFKKDKSYSVNSKISLQIEKQRFLRFTLINNRDTLSSKLLKFRYRNGHLISVHNWQLQGIPLLFYRFGQNAISISLDKNSNLILDCNQNGNGGLFIIIFGYPISYYSYKFKKVK